MASAPVWPYDWIGIDARSKRPKPNPNVSVRLGRDPKESRSISRTVRLNMGI